MKITRALGLSTFVAYLFSFSLLFGLNADLLQLVPSLSMTGFNSEGLQEQTRIMILNYLLPGLLMALFGVSISKEFKAESSGRIGSYMFMLSGIGWMSFSFSPFIMDTSNSLWFVFYLKVFLLGVQA